MATIQEYHQQIKDHLQAERWEQAQALWLDLATRLSDQPEFLLVLVKEFSDAGQGAVAADLAALVAPGLREAGKLHEWLYALKLQARERPRDKALRAELREAYLEIYQADPRLKTILGVTGMDDGAVPLSAALSRVDALLALAPGTYSRHKSWGFGQVKSFDTTLQRIVVAFPHNPEHAMQLAYAAESLTPLSPDHLEVRKITDLKSLQQMAADDPVALVRLALLGHERAATADQVEAALSGAVIPADQWKRWWENARKLVRRDPHFEWPARKTDPIRLRAAPVSQQDELLEAFRQAVDLTQQSAVAASLLKIVDQIADPELLLQEFLDGLLAALRQNRFASLADRVEATVLIDRLRACQRTPTESGSTALADLAGSVGNLGDLLDQLGVQTQKRVMAALKTSQPDRLLARVNELPARVLDEISDLLPRVADRIAQHVHNQTASLELLHWLCKTATAPAPPAWMSSFPKSVLLVATLEAVEAAPNRTVNKKLRDLLQLEVTLIPELLAEASPDTVRDLARQVLAGSAFEELERRSLMGRFVKEFPFVQDLLVSRPGGVQPLLVSHASFEKRQAELDEIVQKKIPQNSREIAQARSYGDLSENFEFKAAKDMQRLLMRRRAELESLLVRAQTTNFADVKTATVQVGTSVTVTALGTGQQQTFHVLGAWDSNPERNVISYPAALAQAFLGKPVGESVEAQTEHGAGRYRIDRIDKVPAEILQSL